MHPQKIFQELLVIFKNFVISVNARTMILKKHVAINLHAHETQEPIAMTHCKQTDMIKNVLKPQKTHNENIAKNACGLDVFCCKEKCPMQTTLPIMQFCIGQKNEQCKLHWAQCTLHCFA